MASHGDNWRAAVVDFDELVGVVALPPLLSFALFSSRPPPLFLLLRFALTEASSPFPRFFSLFFCSFLSFFLRPSPLSFLLVRSPLFFWFLTFHPLSLSRQSSSFFLFTLFFLQPSASPISVSFPSVFLLLQPSKTSCVFLFFFAFSRCSHLLFVLLFPFF